MYMWHYLICGGTYQKRKGTLWYCKWAQNFFLILYLNKNNFFLYSYYIYNQIDTKSTWCLCVKTNFDIKARYDRTRCYPLESIWDRYFDTEPLSLLLIYIYLLRIVINWLWFYFKILLDDFRSFVDRGLCHLVFETL